MDESKVLKAGTAENPFKVDVEIKTSGAQQTVFCQKCDMTFHGELFESRVKYFDHQSRKHNISVPRLHSFLLEESPAEVEFEVWRAWKAKKS